MRFSQLVAFCKVVELGSFTRAAEALVVTQPAVSLHVRSLEQELGTRLFERMGAEVVATRAGATLYDHARTILDARDDAQKEIAAMCGDFRETLTLGASATGMAYHLPPLLRSFMDRQPSYEVLTRVDITDRVVRWAADGQVDLALVWGHVDSPDLIEEHLGYDRLVVICPPGHPLDAGEEAAADRLAAHPFVLATRGSATRRFVEGCLVRVGVCPHLAAEFSATADMKRAVEAGMGIAVVALKAVEEELAEGRLRVVRVQGLDLWRPVSLIAPRHRPLSAGTSILATFLARELDLPAHDADPRRGEHPGLSPAGRSTPNGRRAGRPEVSAPAAQPAAVAKPHPAIEPDPAAQPAAVAKPHPAAQPAPVTKPHPAIEPDPAAQPAAVAKPHPAPQPHPAIEPAPAAQPATVAKPHPAIEPGPAAQPAAVAQPATVAKPHPAIEPGPAAQPAAVAKPHPAIEPAPAAPARPAPLPVDAAHTIGCPRRGGARIDISRCFSPEPCIHFEAVRLTRKGGSLVCRHTDGAAIGSPR